MDGSLLQADGWHGSDLNVPRSPHACMLRPLLHEIHASMQLEGQAMRKSAYLKALLARLISPPTDESERLAFVTK